MERIKMSEHMSITGDIEFFHLPYEGKGSFSYCHHCKKPLKKLTMELHQGWTCDYTQARCPKCKKTIWVAALTTDETEKEFKEANGGRHLVEVKNKCRGCGKETNRWDCFSYTFTKNGKIMCCCSEKCEVKRWKKNPSKKT